MGKNSILKIILRWFVFCIELLFFILGFFAVMIVSHEAYHLHLDGKSSGICIGFCHAQDNIKAPAVIHWSEEVFVGYNEERNAWIFGLAVSLFLYGIFFFWKLYDKH